MQSHENKQTFCGSQEAAAERRRSLAPIVRTPRERRSSLLNCAICLTSISSAMKAGASSSHSCVRRKFLMLQWLLGGTTPPELRAPLRSRRASITYIDEIIMMTKVWQSCLTFWKCSTRPPKVKNKFYVSKTHYFKCLSTVSTWISPVKLDLNYYKRGWQFWVMDIIANLRIVN